MTIAACYVSREGVVLGSDSTTTFTLEPNHYLNHAQKIFEIGENSTFGVVTWGHGRLQDVSYRTFTGHIADDLQKMPPQSVQDVAERWGRLLWPEYQASFTAKIARAKELLEKEN